MVKFIGATLAIVDDAFRNSKITVTAKIRFEKIEYCIMEHCKDAEMFYAVCRVYGKEPKGQLGERLYSFPAVYHFPDAETSMDKVMKFEAEVGADLLDEDTGSDDERIRGWRQSTF